MKRSFLGFFFSNIPFYALIFFVAFVAMVLTAKVIDAVFNLGLNFTLFLCFIFEPVLILTFILVSVVSLVVYVYFWADLLKRDDIDEQHKQQWKIKFLRLGVIASSLYYESKYGRGEKCFFLERFIVKSREKIFGQ